LKRLLFFGMLSFAATVCRADLIGTTVTGFLGFTPPTNWYDPANGFVPATGYQNSASNKNSPTVQIVGGNEFGFNDGFNLDVTSFSGTGFTFTDTTFSVGSTPITLHFTDIAFGGISEISSTFAGLTFGIAGDVITINIPVFTTTDRSIRSASFSVTPSVPEPDSLILLTTAVLAVGLLVGKKHLRSRSTIES
jgi:hypothetical protein